MEPISLENLLRIRPVGKKTSSLPSTFQMESHRRDWCQRTCKAPSWCFWTCCHAAPPRIACRGQRVRWFWWRRQHKVRPLAHHRCQGGKGSKTAGLCQKWKSCFLPPVWEGPRHPQLPPLISYFDSSSNGSTTHQSRRSKPGYDLVHRKCSSRM